MNRNQVYFLPVTSENPYLHTIKAEKLSYTGEILNTLQTAKYHYE